MSMAFLYVASLGPADAFQSDTGAKMGVQYLAVLATSTAELVEAIGTCFIVDGSRFDMAIFVIAENAMKRVDWAVVYPIFFSTFAVRYANQRGFCLFRQRLYLSCAVGQRRSRTSATATWG